MIEPGLLLRKEIIITSIGEIEVEEFTYFREYYFDCRVSLCDIITQISYITGIGKMRLENLTEEEKSVIMESYQRVNTPIKLPSFSSSEKTIPGTFFDSILTLCEAKIGSLKEIILTYSRQQINELYHCVIDKSIRFNNLDSNSNQSIDAAIQNATPKSRKGQNK